ncbi:MAG: helix-turn-helix transcriptional regulator, partial [Luteimonas sp.]|nr:helix-turn-helix transcriptional regulator [Luteimonas sp.]
AGAFAAPVAFDRPDTRVVIDRHWLGQPMPAANPDSARQLQALCRAQMPSNQPPAGIVATLEQRLALQVASNPRLTDLAAELHLTERTLRRQLRAADTSFRELLDRARERAACVLLRDAQRPVAQVAAEVGFRDPRDFRRAFKRWTGRLPRDMRDDSPAGRKMD